MFGKWNQSKKKAQEKLDLKIKKLEFLQQKISLSNEDNLTLIINNQTNQTFDKLQKKNNHIKVK